MFPLLFLVVDSRIVDRYFSFSLGVDMSLSLVSFFSRQAAAKERKRNVTDQNYQKLRDASSAYINERRKERKEKKFFFFFACYTSNNGCYSGRRVLVLFLRLLAIQKWNEERKKAAKRAQSHLTDFFIDNNHFLVCKNYLFFKMRCHINHKMNISVWFSVSI